MRCDRCGAENPANLIFCRDCGNRLPHGEVPATAARPAAPAFEFSARGGSPAPAQAPAPAPCPRCGTPNPPQNRFCSGCGAPLTGAAPPAPAPVPQAPGYAPAPPVAPPAAVQPAPVNPRPPVAAASAAPPQARPSVVCARCRGMNPQGMHFCQFCGAPLAGDSAALPQAPAAVQPRPVASPSGGPGPAWQAEPRGPAPAPHIPEAPRGLVPAARGGARLIVITQDGTPGRTYEVTEAQVDVGREEGGIVLPNDPYVSPRHARLRRQNSQFLVRDLGSVNGVYVRLRRPEKLEHGDLVLLGLEVLRFEIVSEAEKTLGPALDRGTQVFGSPATTRHARLCQRTIEGITRDVYSLYRDETVIGRESGDIVFTSDPFMSRQHASISRDPHGGGFTIKDLGSSNGTYLAIRGEVALQSGDHVRIGQHLFRLEVDPE